MHAQPDYIRIPIKLWFEKKRDNCSSDECANKVASMCMVQEEKMKSAAVPCQ